MATQQPTGIAAAMKYFGRKNVHTRDGVRSQTLSEFKDEWNGLTVEDKHDIISGLENQSLTY